MTSLTSLPATISQARELIMGVRGEIGWLADLLAAVDYYEPANKLERAHAAKMIRLALKELIAEETK